MKIKAPDSSHSGIHHFGSTVIEFKDGVADFDGELPPGVRQYMAGAGYGFGSHNATAPEEVPAPPDPREVTHVQGGTPLRDAAVDPQPEDFLPPTNAGKEGPEGNPHGPTVVAPQIHASTGQPVVAGPVGKFGEDEDGARVVIPDTDAQQERETEFAQRALVDNESVPEVLTDLGKKAGQPAPGAEADEALELKGAALDEALDEAGLSKSGTADEKRQRLAEYRAG